MSDRFASLHPHTYFLFHESDQPCYNILNHFCNFAGSQVQAFIFQVSRSPLYTQRSVIYIMCIIIFIGTKPLSISFLMYPIPTDLFATLSLFFIVHNHGFEGSRVGGFTKGSILKISLVRPRHLHVFPNNIKCGLMLIIDLSRSKNIVINSEGLEEIVY
jgi:hypothetical protein